jgi:pathogenesis-related protein 1
MRAAGWALLFAAAAAGQPPDLARDMLAAHNSVRKKLGVAPMVWSEKLAANARTWAGQLLKSGKFEHQGGPYGENLFEVRGPGAQSSAAEVAGYWAAEASDYDYGTNRCRQMCGHYTQMVWRGTRQVGCAVARNTKREVWVCEYSPPGNVVGQRPY